MIIKIQRGLDSAKGFAAHDSRFDIDVNQIDLNKKSGTPRLNIGHIGESGEYSHSSESESVESQLSLEFPEWQNAIYTKIVEKCGDRKYWSSGPRTLPKLQALLRLALKHCFPKKNRSKTEKSKDFRAQFTDFLKSLQANINPSITEEEAVDMLSQHIITQPVFDAF